MNRWIFLLFLCPLLTAAADLRLGIIGTDTSHVVAFTQVLNNPSHPDHLPGAKVVVAYKGGSPDVESSHTRVDKFAAELEQKWNVKFVDSIAAMKGQVDGILLESVDGRAHLKQFRQAAELGKPVFIDKPLASTYKDAVEIARIARQKNIPWFSSSSLRWAPFVQKLSSEKNSGVIAWGPGPLEEHHYLDLSWYGVHPTEILFALMGPGCVEVTRQYTEDADVVTCRWNDGRLGTVRTIRPYGDYGAVVFRGKEVLTSDPRTKVSYTPMLAEIVKFFQTGKPPVANEVTLEIFAFMDAAQRSREKAGAPMKLQR